MARYFRILGIIEFVLYGILVFLGFLGLFGTFGKLDGFSYVLYICGYIIFLIVGPAFGLLLLSHATLLEKHEESEEDNEINKMKEIIRNSLKIEDENIIINGVSYKKNEIRELECRDKTIVFTINGQYVTIECNDYDEAEVIYHCILNEIKTKKKKTSER